MMKFFSLSPQLVAICLSRHRKLTYRTVFNYPWIHRLSREHLLTIWVAPDNLHTDWHTGVNVCQINRSMCPRRLTALLDTLLEASYLMTLASARKPGMHLEASLTLGSALKLRGPWLSLTWTRDRCWAT